MPLTWLKQIRSEQSLTQAAVASAAGIKPARYSRIEAGYCELRDEEIKALADALKQTVEFIQTGKRSSKAKESGAATIKTEPVPAIVALPPVVASFQPVIAPKGLTAAKAIEPTPTSKRGDDLSDAANFTLMPPTEALVRGSLAPLEFKNRLQQHLVFATKVLHTSKVKPRIWVAWRDFSKEAQNHLRGESELVAQTVVEPKPVQTPKPAALVTPSTPAPTTSQSRRERGNKNLFGYFVEVAKELLPAERLESLSALATDAKKQRPELGFMKHFKLIAEAELSPSDFGKIAAEAEQRFSA
jgi:transcriptional regulator with XRE-family HTH domain